MQAGSANSGTLRAEAMEGTLLSNVTISPRRSQRLAEKVGLSMRRDKRQPWRRGLLWRGGTELTELTEYSKIFEPTVP